MPTDETLKALDDIRRGANTLERELVSIEPGTEESEPPMDLDPWLIVGKAEGAPGKTVVVEILGTTQESVRGFSMGIGCNPAELTLVRAEITPEFSNPVGLAPHDLTLVYSQGAKGGIQDYLSIMAGFFKPELGGANLDAVIPHMTPMVRLWLRISDTVVAGERLKLDNRGGYYGRKLKGPDGRETRLLIDNHYVATPRKYLRTKLVSGWIDVL